MSKKVLITGGASFIGSHLAEALLERGCRVSILDNFSSGDEENIREIAGDVEVWRGDAEEIIQGALAGQDSVFHLAARHGGRGYIESHEKDCLSNMALGRRTGLISFASFSSSSLLSLS